MDVPEYTKTTMLYCCDDDEGHRYPADLFSKQQVANDSDCEVDEVCSDTGWWHSSIQPVHTQVTRLSNFFLFVKLHYS